MIGDRPLREIGDRELLAELAECISLEGEAEARAEPLRAELLRRQMESGETAVAHDGWVSQLKRSPVSPAWMAKQHGYPAEELPPELFTERITAVLDEAKALAWLAEKGHDTRLPYTVQVGRQKHS